MILRSPSSLSLDSGGCHGSAKNGWSDSTGRFEPVSDAQIPANASTVAFATQRGRSSLSEGDVQQAKLAEAKLATVCIEIRTRGVITVLPRPRAAATTAESSSSEPWRPSG